ncbi:heparin lyase I family protein [Aureimonas sp. AU22]|uniref:heparin lyase I family protein n=1 Tax=Aureimonas sp. AU22 TaxID=1638162 RepID=UPI00070695C6|nr:heparin lyase I family protein [Aureimonas sp. AU22]BAT29893.1 hypothetical protein [Aureimonas sp. AU22]
MTPPPRARYRLTRRQAGVLFLSGCASALVSAPRAMAAGSAPAPVEEADVRRSTVLRDFRDLRIDGTTYRTQTANRYPTYRKPWALTRFDDADEFRFELRDGDGWAGDKDAKPPRNRAEMQQRGAALPASGEAIWFTDTIAVETDDKPRSPWTIVNQLHSGIARVNPLLFTQLIGTKLLIHTSFDRSDVAKPGPGTLRYADQAFERRRYTRLVYRVVLGDGTGELTIWRDGRSIVDETGLSIGFPNDKRCTPHLKWGQYRRAGTQTYAVRHANVEGATLASLEARVRDPRPLASDPLVAAPRRVPS